MTASDWVPTTILKFARTIEDKSGVKPTVERTKSDRWKVTLENARVKNVLTYKITSGGRAICTNSELWVDGEPHKLFTNHDEFYEMFLYTEEVLAREKPKAELPALPGEGVEPDLSTAPAFIRAVHGSCRAKVAKMGGTVTVGGSEIAWAIQVETEHDGVQQLVRFTVEEANGDWHLQEPTLVIDGRIADVQDLSPALLELLMEILNGPASHNAQPRSAITGASRVRTTANSVLTRRASVIRN